MNDSFKLLAILLFFVVFSACRENNNTPKSEQPKADFQQETVAKEEQISHKQVAAGGDYSFERPENFGLAVNSDQILVKSMIPPCEVGFDYCLYYNGEKYNNTNFETAGVGFYVVKNKSETACFSAAEYNGRKGNLHTETINGIQFTVFDSGDAAMGHYANDVVYQTFQNGTCYRFIARVGTSQFDNYEKGTIEKFDPQMEKEIKEDLKKIIRGINFNQK